MTYASEGRSPKRRRFAFSSSDIDTNQIQPHRAQSRSVTTAPTRRHRAERNDKWALDGLHRQETPSSSGVRSTTWTRPLPRQRPTQLGRGCRRIRDSHNGSLRVEDTTNHPLEPEPKRYTSNGTTSAPGSERAEVAAVSGSRFPVGAESSPARPPRDRQTPVDSIRSASPSSTTRRNSGRDRVVKTTTSGAPTPRLGPPATDTRSSSDGSARSGGTAWSSSLRPTVPTPRSRRPAAPTSWCRMWS